MDVMVRPVRVPPQIPAYADKHSVSHLLQSMVSSLVMDQPEDPLSHLLGLLQRTSVDVPRVTLLGPPAVGKHTVAKRLSAELGAVHVTTHSLLRDQSDLGAHSEQELPVELLVRRLHHRLKEVDCFNRGWVLEGLPQTRLQALSLQQAGIIPEHVVILDAPDGVLKERSEGRLVDPLTGDIYHQTFIWPGDDTIAQRLEKGRGPPEEQRLADLQRYRREVTGLSSAYQNVLKVVSGDQPHTDVYQQVLAFIRTRRRSRTPRILLLGPLGSGRSLQARLLSERYKMVDVCCARLVRSAAADGSSLGAQIRSYLEDGRPAPDSVVLRVLEGRLSQVDCSCRGWILHGFPRDLQQARILEESQHQPNRVFFLDVTDEVCLERISLSATDPVSGERFHAVTRPAPSAEVQDRLKTRPEDRTNAVTQRLKQDRIHNAGLQALESRLTVD